MLTTKATPLVQPPSTRDRKFLNMSLNLSTQPKSTRASDKHSGLSQKRGSKAETQKDIRLPQSNIVFNNTMNLQQFLDQQKTKKVVKTISNPVPRADSRSKRETDSMRASSKDGLKKTTKRKSTSVQQARPRASEDALLAAKSNRDYNRSPGKIFTAPS